MDLISGIDDVYWDLTEGRIDITDMRQRIVYGGKVLLDKVPYSVKTMVKSKGVIICDNGLTFRYDTEVDEIFVACEDVELRQLVRDNFPRGTFANV